MLHLPQLAGLGRSQRAERFFMRSADEATAYLEHPVLGPRLVRCVEGVLAIKDVGANTIFGSPDGMKLRSAMTLFATVAKNGSPVHQVIHQLYAEITTSRPSNRWVNRSLASSHCSFLSSTVCARTELASMVFWLRRCAKPHANQNNAIHADDSIGARIPFSCIGRTA